MGKKYRKPSSNRRAKFHNQTSFTRLENRNLLFAAGLIDGPAMVVDAYEPPATQEVSSCECNCVAQQTGMGIAQQLMNALDSDGDNMLSMAELSVLDNLNGVSDANEQVVDVTEFEMVDETVETTEPDESGGEVTLDGAETNPIDEALTEAENEGLVDAPEVDSGDVESEVDVDPEAGAGDVVDVTDVVEDTDAECDKGGEQEDDGEESDVDVEAVDESSEDEAEADQILDSSDDSDSAETDVEDVVDTIDAEIIVDSETNVGDDGAVELVGDDGAEGDVSVDEKSEAGNTANQGAESDQTDVDDVDVDEDADIDPIDFNTDSTIVGSNETGAEDGSDDSRSDEDPSTLSGDNGDGEYNLAGDCGEEALTSAEAADELLATFDTDGDETLSKDELTAMLDNFWADVEIAIGF